MTEVANATQRRSTFERVRELDRLGMRCRWFVMANSDYCTFRGSNWQADKGGPYCDRHARMAGLDVW